MKFENELQVGDRWGEVLVDEVEHLGADEYYPKGRVHVKGRLCFRTGRPRPKSYHWTFHPDQPLDVERKEASK